MNIVLMGCPGAGKGTQSAKLQEGLKLKHISTGDVLRAEIASGSELGKKIAGIINAGNLVPDELMISMLENIVKSTDAGIIFDGFPRTVAQAEALNAMLKRFHREISAVIMINLPESEVVKRITSRRQCKNAVRLCMWTRPLRPPSARIAAGNYTPARMIPPNGPNTVWKCTTTTRCR